MRGDVDVLAIAKGIMARFVSRTVAMVSILQTKTRQGGTVRDIVGKKFVDHVAGWPDTLLLYSGKDAGLIELESLFLNSWKQLNGLARVQIEVFSDADHAFPEQSDRKRLANVIETYLSRHRPLPDS